MSENNEIKIIKEGFLSAKSDFDSKRESIKSEKDLYDSGIQILYQSWKGKSKDSCVSITDKLNSDYLKLITDAETLSKNMETVLQTYESTDEAIAGTYELGTNAKGGQ